MTDIDPTPLQRQIIEAPLDARVNLVGYAGCGKSTAAALRVRYILEHDTKWPEVMIFTPGRAYSTAYDDLISADGIRPTVTSCNSFMQRCLKLFWPIISDKAGTGHPNEYPMFLTIETAQIIMAKLIRGRMDDGYFSALASSKSRIFNQVLVGMHKCAAAEIPYEKYAETLSGTWGGDAALLPVFEQALECGKLFREVCLKNDLLDYSLQTELFINRLLPNPLFREWVKRQEYHLIFDNTEEEVPAAHHVVRELADAFRSILLISDTGGGYRNFMGCDPISAGELSTLCTQSVELNDSFVCDPAVSALSRVIGDPTLANADLAVSPRSAFSFSASAAYPEMIKKAVSDTAELVNVKGVPPKDIVILAPLVSDVLYTSMEREFRDHGIKVYLRRPSRPLINESITRSLLTLCELVLPVGGIAVRMLDIVQMMQTFIEGLDPMRGNLLVSRTFRPRAEHAPNVNEYDIKPFESISEEARSRIPAEIAERFEVLRRWIENRRRADDNSPEIIITRFFNEVLTRPGFKRSEEINLGVRKAAESMEKFRAVLDYIAGRAPDTTEQLPDWGDYFALIGLGMVSAQYYEEVYAQPEDSILVSLTSAYLPMNRPAAYQIWLNAGAPRWWERFYGELTNDIVLSKRWQEGRKWDVLTASQYNDAHMNSQIRGLLSRCRKQVRIYASDRSESGMEQRSKLLSTFATLTRRFKADKPTEPVPEVDPPLMIREEEPVYPGFSDEPSMDVLLRRAGAVIDFGLDDNDDNGREK